MRAASTLYTLLSACPLLAQGPWQLSSGQQPAATSGPTTGTEKLLVADFEGDRFPDVIIYGGGNQGSQLYLIRNHGPVGYGSEEQVLPAGSAPITRVLAADVDLDGDMDLLVCFGSTGAGWQDPAYVNKLLINDGTGHFTDETAQRWPTGAYSTMDALVIDVNGDGLPDIVECNIGPHKLFLGQPGGTFIDATTTHWSGGSTYGWQIAASDVDGDGSPDLLITGGQLIMAGRDWLYLNDGQGHFRDETWRLPPRPNDFAVAMGDIDGDGDVDLFLGVRWLGHPSHLLSSQVLRNNGSGLFTVDPTALPAQPLFDVHSDARMVDVDGDGDLDLVVEALVNNSTSLFFNDGTGHFTAGLGLLPALPSCLGLPVFVPADVDADGDRDLVTASALCTQRVFVFHSLQRHLTAAAPPRIGQPFQLDLDGQPNGIGILGVALGSQFLPLPPLGTLQLDLHWYALLGAVALDSSGHGTLTVPIPQVPGIAGVNVYLQGFVTTSPWGVETFTNAFGTTIGP